MHLHVTQAEAVAALVNARTAAAADSALAGLSGGLGAAIASMRSDALAMLAELEVRGLSSNFFPAPARLLSTLENALTLEAED